MLIGRRVTVMGAGIAGLAVARALALRGAQVTVLEQADAIREVGAGIQVSPNGAKVLRALGLGDALETTGPRCEAVELLDGETGSRVIRMDLAKLRPGAEYRFVHRARLIEILAQGAREAGVEIKLGCKIEDVDLASGKPKLLTARGETLEPDLLIGADGLHSRVRRALNGESRPFFTHQVAWRALVPSTDDEPRTAQVFLGAGKHLVTYPLGRGLRNIVAVEERWRWVEESWNMRDDPLTMLAAFEEFCPQVQDWLEAIKEPWLWGLFRHPVARVWQGRGAVILGDAAHPTLPFLAQGAVMALEDAWVLAQALSKHDSDEVALGVYQSMRAARCKAIVEAANQNARNYHLSGFQRTLGHAALRAASLIAPGQVLNRYDWVHGYDVTTEI
ncbi:salicylate hydroxylase [Rhodobacter aestuarii]|uniref:Salicylate hydroxylase n=2 Tax=Rhodobacter aestuarii TaxID=453582 RepID=A0A1N7J0J6_9RHOB|nr:salicylate hydroxylase [Rhodobacter aestuarii]SIS42741.1 salicylate hydroxylase [Rhodobacter aestuarii]